MLSRARLRRKVLCEWTRRYKTFSRLSLIYPIKQRRPKERAPGLKRSRAVRPVAAPRETRLPTNWMHVCSVLWFGLIFWPPVRHAAKRIVLRGGDRVISFRAKRRPDAFDPNTSAASLICIESSSRHQPASGCSEYITETLKRGRWLYGRCVLTATLQSRDGASFYNERSHSSLEMANVFTIGHINYTLTNC